MLHLPASSVLSWLTQPAALPSNKSNPRNGQHSLHCKSLMAPVFPPWRTGFSISSIVDRVTWKSSRSPCGLEDADFFLQQFLSCIVRSSTAERQSLYPDGEHCALGVADHWCLTLLWVQRSCGIPVPTAPGFPRLPHIKPQYTSPPALARLWMPETWLILVDCWLCWTRLVCRLLIHTQAVQPSYSWARLSRFVASLITKST